MILDLSNTKFALKGISSFKRGLKRVIKQGKDINKLVDVLKIIANGNILPEKYKDHSLTSCKKYINCRECHIEPDWLLVYKYNDDELILLLIDTGSHSELF